VTQERTNKGVVSVQRKYEDKGWLMADVALRNRRYDPETRHLHVTLEVDPGPKVDIRAAEDAISKRTLKKYVPVYQEMAVDQDLLVAGATNLRDYFQSKGYFDAAVDFRQQQPDEQHLTVEYVVNLGQRYKLVSVEIQGNQFFTASDLRERMFLLESGLIRFRQGRYSQTFLARDREAIENLYRANGFHDVAVDTRVENDFKGKTGEVGVTFVVTEGPMWTVRSLELAGMEDLTRVDVEGDLSSIEGQPYSEVSIARDRDMILTRYQQAGYPEATLEFKATPNPETHQMDLIYTIAEGRRQIVRDVVVNGIELTKMRIVNKRITLAPNDPLSLVQMSSIQQRLYNLGVFARIDMAVQNQVGTTEFKRVIYDFHEASRYSLAVGVGAEFARIGGTTSDLSRPEGAPGLSPRISADLSRLNLWGMGHSVSLRGRLSNLEQLASVSYLAPRFHDVDGRNVTFTMQFQKSRDVRTFSSRREEASLQMTQQLSKAVTVMGRIAYRRVTVTNVVIPSLLIPQFLQPVRIGIISGNIVQDRRNDPTNATRGIYNTLDIGIASNYFGSQRSFLRTLGRNATYHPIRKNVIFARETSVGLIFPFNVPAGIPEEDAIPLPERFYGGGSATHRGFPENQAGPRDTGQRPGGVTAPATGFPLGGNALFFNQVELRFPLLGENIGGVLFHDMGNIYDRIGNISFRVRQPENGFNYMVHATGFGVRYKTPVGPIRGDLAYSINPPRYRGFDGTTAELLACGATGERCQAVPRRVSHFQFFFSIGQTF
jgi:outer membrane protein assembly complex protein YaeT